jgi:hypothetical protein
METGSVPFPDAASRHKEFQDGITRITTFFQERNLLTECGDMPHATAPQTHWFEAVSPSFMEGYDPPCHTDSDNTPDRDSFNLSNLLLYINNNSNSPYLTRDWDAIVIVTDNNVLGEGVPGMFEPNSNPPVIYLRTGGTESFSPGESNIFTHEWGHSRGLGEEYRHETSIPNELNTVDGCDPLGECCSYTNQTLLRFGYPSPNLCLGNIALDISNWSWDEDPNLPGPYDTDVFDQKNDRPDPSEGFNGNIIHGRCIMSRARAHGTPDQRGWCRSCLKHLRGKGVTCDSAMGSTQTVPRVVRALEVSGEVMSSGLTTVGFHSMGLARLPVLPAGSEGAISIVATDCNNSPIYQFGIVNPKYSDFTEHNYHADVIREKYQFYQRIPINADQEGPIRLTTFVESSMTSQVTIGGSPAVAVANDLIRECQSPLGTTIELDGSGSYDPDGDTLFFSWHADHTELDNTDTYAPYGAFQLGNESVTMKVTDGTGAGSYSTIIVTVEDTTPPEFLNIDDIVFSICDEKVLYAFLTPEVFDMCGDASVIDGRIVSINGNNLSQSIEVMDKELAMEAGVYEVQWKAQDEHGNIATKIQNIVIKNGIRATSSIDVKDHAKIIKTNGQAAAVSNSGTGTVEVGANSIIGSIVSQGNVSGVIQSGGSVSIQNNVIINNPGTVSQNAQIDFAALWDDDLTWLEFPVPQNHNIVFNPSSVAYTLPPGSYGHTTLNSGATVVLSAGVYYFSSLTINSASRMVIDQNNGNVTLIIKSDFSFREPLVNEINDLASVYLVYAGTSDGVMESAPFKGTVVSPFARLKLGQNIPLEFQGRFMAKSIEVARSVTLVCDENTTSFSGNHGIDQ